ncbi:MAG: TlpA disulfide reductase family protein [Prevotella sp.]|nr:TlpA disulfide reductase family protein [Prevotella sp.]
MKHFTTIALWFIYTIAIAQNFTLKGTIHSNDYDGLSIFLVRLHPADRSLNTTVDSARIENGQFCFSLSVTTPFLASISLPPKDNYHYYGLPETMCIAEPGNVAISYSPSDAYSVTLSGGKLNADYDATILSRDREVRRKIKSMIEARNAQEQTVQYSLEQEQAYNDSLRSLYATMQPAYNDFVARNINNDVGASLFFLHQNDFSEACYKSLKTKVRSDYVFCHDSIMQAKEMARNREDSIRSANHRGARYSDFTSFTPDGKPVALSSLLKPGRILLLDFWASWCSPCRMEIPEIKKLYEKYHDKGFDVVSVSLDTKREAWTKALDAEQMPWLQLSTLEGFKSKSAQAYAVHAIPFVVLISGNGNILQVNIHGQLLEKNIEENLNN